MELSEAINLIRYDGLSQEFNATWADLGSGSGLFTYALASVLPIGSVIYAVDQQTVVLGKHSNPKNTIIRQQQANFITDELHLPPLDGILMANSLHFVKDKVALIQKLSNYLKENSGFLIVEYDTDAANKWVPFPVSYQKLKLLFKQTGYIKVTKLQEKPSLYGRANLYATYISR
jgi:trans-aconitate methyltransferase